MRTRIVRILAAVLLALALVSAHFALSPSTALANRLCYSTGWYWENPRWYRDTELYYEGGGRYVFQEDWFWPAINGGGTSYFSCYK